MKEKYYYDEKKNCNLLSLFFRVSDFSNWAEEWSNVSFDIINLIFWIINIFSTIGIAFSTTVLFTPDIEQGGIWDGIIWCVIIVLTTLTTFIIIRLLSVIVIKGLAYVFYCSYFPKQKNSQNNKDSEYKLFYEVKNQELSSALDSYVKEYIKSKKVYAVMEREDEFVSKMSVIDTELRALVGKYYKSFDMDNFPEIICQLKEVISSATEYTQKMRKTVINEYNLQFKSDMTAIKDFIGLKN